VKGRRHHKFASTESNFAELDHVLKRLERRTIQEVEEAERAWEEAPLIALTNFEDEYDEDGEGMDDDGAHWVELD
jgi:hypothetical protein